MSEKKRTIMLGFHSPVDGRLLREWLTGSGYEVVESLDDTVEIDLVLMDSVTARRLMDKALGVKSEAKYFLPVLICIHTGQDVSPWLKAGFDDVLRLPGSKAEWKARIEIMLRLRRQSEELGQKSERLYRSLIESSDDHIFLLDANGTYVTSNDRVDHLGLDLGDDVVGKTIDQVYPQEVAPFYRTQLQRVLTEGKTVAFEHDLPSDQETYHHLDTLYPVNLPDGAVMVGGICRDITEQKQAGEALKEARSNLQALLDNRDDSIWSLDRNYNYIVFNKPYADVIYSNLGVRLEKGMNALDIHPKEVADTWKPKFDKVLKGKYVTFEFSHFMDGKEYFFEVHMNPIYTDNKVSGLSALSMDITDRKQAEESLRISEEQNRSITQTAADAIITINSAGMILSWNHAAQNIFGYSTSEMLGLELSSIIPEQYQSGHKAGIKRLAEGANSKLMGQTIELSAIHKDGSEFPVELSLSTWRSRDTQYFTGIIRDISKRKQAQRNMESALHQAETANQVKDQFIANISHEIRTPLNSILGFSDLFKQKYGEMVSVKDKEIFQYIANSSNRLMRTVDSILNISQLEAGSITPQRQELELDHLVRCVIGEIKSAADHKGLQLVFKPCDRPAMVYVDEYSVHQAILNLVDNAIKYTDTGKIEIRLQSFKHQYKLAIQDTGIGISEEYQKRIFEPYSQESEGLTKNYQGIGLGLALTKRYLELNGIGIELDSTKNVGTTFTLIFPKYEGGDHV